MPEDERTIHWKFLCYLEPTLRRLAQNSEPITADDDSAAAPGAEPGERA